MVTEFMTTIVLWCAILLQRVEVRLTENRRSLALLFFLRIYFIPATFRLKFDD